MNSRRLIPLAEFKTVFLFAIVSPILFLLSRIHGRRRLFFLLASRQAEQCHEYQYDAQSFCRLYKSFRDLFSLAFISSPFSVLCKLRYFFGKIPSRFFTCV
jgi:hypothetical protein